MAAGTSPASGVNDRSGRLGAIPATARVVLELGCGGHKRHADAIGVDRRELPGVDVVGDVFDVLSMIPDGSVDAVYSYHFFEHVEDLERLTLELSRVTRPSATVTTVVPHFSNPYFYSDYTHRRAFGLYSFSYLAEDRLLHRKVPRYVEDTGFELKEVSLIFKCAPPFYGRHAMARAIGILVNSCRFAKEFYESTLSPWVPCYEVRFVMVRRPGPCESKS